MPGPIGIRREDKNIWERRVPLTPAHVKQLFDQFQVPTRIQPFPKRAFSDDEFRAAKAEVAEDLSPCPVIFAVKEIPPALLLPQKTYLFFSHTIKGQRYNMPMLKRLLDLRCTLIDYECIKDANNQRLVFFGRFAGLAGMLDGLYGLGQRLLALGLDSPFLHLKPALQYHDLEEAKTEIKKLGEEIRQKGLPSELTPLTIGFSGYGQVSKGAQEILDLLPHRQVQPDELLLPQTRPSAPIIKTVFREQDMVEPIEPGYEFSLRDYYVHPLKYRSKFEKYLPQLDLLVNGIYWDERYPRLVTKDYLRKNYSAGRHPLKMIVDISCDINGSIEITEKATQPDMPAFVYNPSTDQITDGYQGEGIVNIAVDNLPAELPRDASAAFSNSLWSFVPAIYHADTTIPFADCHYPPEIKKAVIVHDGKLTPDFEYLRQHLTGKI
ncbi:MAG TPA: bifunctional lysine ketoglutarate reductase /saccharopine dehydrogenase family protein [bacterium]|jgi:alpha-aminoadipic semialdehyde synthase|nr:bifunctional lysine ketoglutarate reductase /saccharopine dehydrogenase family protein [bacterium]HNT64434.1 bifunctional lysine ketoglutarate reductase /saccharopine dehydrogenase family protein [bacterium]HOX84719.1 bifunctional lysine ketoglutarate reductase /saccharopine dehydrogenase family protein [bacterium]HPG45442.1 bifunctional lysine ketoglutarate reductase /saccharopine dehydrogenase family protein [bacterium]HPM96782.1 bifunctional lysine ketoglutarate reductase /saccharopine de